MSALLSDALQDPTRLLLELFDRTVSIDGFPAVVSQYFSDVFKAVDSFQQIPPLDVCHPPEAYSDRSLVSFRAMVQDPSPAPELYLARRDDGTCGGWGLTCGLPTDYTFLKECTILWAISIPGESPWCSQKSIINNNTTSASIHNPPLPHKFPMRSAPHVGVQIKIYENDGAKSFKSTDIASFVGILTSEPWHCEQEHAIYVPTLHVLFSRRLPSTIVPQPYPASVNIPVVQEELITWIAEEALGGDRVAAELVLLSSIARVQSRTPPVLPPSLTLSRFPLPAVPTEVPTLYHVLTEILPICSILPLSLTMLNCEKFSPESKEEDLHSGLLQMPAGTSFLLSESGVQEGKLVEKGIMNVRAIQGAMSSQTIDYVFPYSRFPFQMDATFIVLGEGQKSAFFQTDVILPMQQPVGSHLYKKRDQLKLPSPEKLALFRQLVGGAKSGSVQIDKAVSEHIQEDFVQERTGNKPITIDDFVLRMTMAKLSALLAHDKVVRINHWQRIKELDKRRQARNVEQD